MCVCVFGANPPISILGASTIFTEKFMSHRQVGGQGEREKAIKSVNSIYQKHSFYCYICQRGIICRYMGTCYHWKHPAPSPFYILAKDFILFRGKCVEYTIICGEIFSAQTYVVISRLCKSSERFFRPLHI